MAIALTMCLNSTIKEKNMIGMTNHKQVIKLLSINFCKTFSKVMHQEYIKYKY